MASYTLRWQYSEKNRNERLFAQPKRQKMRVLWVYYDVIIKPASRSLTLSI